MDSDPGHGAQEEVKLSDAASFLMHECRMVLPGVQALFGFQLIAVFSERFDSALGPEEQVLHVAALSLVALAGAMLMAPAAYHRSIGVRRVSERFIRNSTRLLMGSMLPLAA